MNSLKHLPPARPPARASAACAAAPVYRPPPPPSQRRKPGRRTQAPPGAPAPPFPAAVAVPFGQGPHTTSDRSARILCEGIRKPLLTASPVSPQAPRFCLPPFPDRCITAPLVSRQRAYRSSARALPCAQLLHSFPGTPALPTSAAWQVTASRLSMGATPHTVMLAVHCKRGEATDIKGPVRKYVHTNYGEHSAEECNDDLEAMQGWRTSMIGQNASPEHLLDILAK